MRHKLQLRMSISRQSRLNRSGPGVGLQLGGESRDDVGDQVSARVPRFPRLLFQTSLALLTCPLVLFGSADGQLSAGPSTSVGTVVGMVIDGRTGTPVPEAQVELRPLPIVLPPGSRPNLTALRRRPARPSALSGSDGRFVLSDVPADTYVLVARKGGYAGGYFGQFAPASSYQNFDLRGGERASGIQLRLWPGAVIAGSVRDSKERPATGKVVQAIRITRGMAGVALFPVITTAGVHENGDYRLTGLTTGQYFVRVTTQSPKIGLTLDSDTIPSLAYYPDATLLTDARAVTVVDPGEEQLGVDIRIPEAGRGVPLEGRVVGLSRAYSGLQVRLVAGRATEMIPEGLEISKTNLRPDGTFQFPNVPPGQYIVRILIVPEETRAVFPGIVVTANASGMPVSRPDTHLPIAPPISEPMWCSELVTIMDKPIRGLVLQTNAGARVTGRIVLDPELKLSPAEMTGMTVVSRRAGTAGWNLDGLILGRVEADGTFTSSALPPGRYSVKPFDQATWYTESIMWNGRDVLGEGVEVGTTNINGLVVTLSGRRAAVSGLVKDGAGKIRSDAVIYVYPAESRNWVFGEMAEVRPNRAGEYRLSLSAGRWTLAAAVGHLPSEWQDRDFLKTLTPNGVTVLLKRGEQATAELSAKSIR